eukprot:49976-Eustigmatos_ZCMA.PRE.1
MSQEVTPLCSAPWAHRQSCDARLYERRGSTVTTPHQLTQSSSQQSSLPSISDTNRRSLPRKSGMP